MASKPNYFQNIANEINQVYQAFKKTDEMSNTPGPGTDAQANALRALADKEQGQFFGALLQGRRYDTKGKQIKK